VCSPLRTVHGSRSQGSSDHDHSPTSPVPRLRQPHPRRLTLPAMHATSPTRAPTSTSRRRAHGRSRYTMRTMRTTHQARRALGHRPHTTRLEAVTSRMQPRARRRTSRVKSRRANRDARIFEQAEPSDTVSPAANNTLSGAASGALDSEGGRPVVLASPAFRPEVLRSALLRTCSHCPRRTRSVVKRPPPARKR
jgi:hypothetical protein